MKFDEKIYSVVNDKHGIVVDSSAQNDEARGQSYENCP
jgi:hypothetical protein